MMKRLRQNQKNILILAGLMGLCLLMRLHRFDSMYLWDEANYRQAANLGLKALYLDQNSLDFSHYIKKGFIKYYHLGDHLITYPEGYSPDNDNLIRSQQHPPLMLYLIRITSLCFGESEFSARFPSLFFALLTIPLVFFGSLKCFNKSGRIIGVVACLLIALMPMYIASNNIVSTHNMFAFFSLGSLFSLLYYQQEKKMKYLVLFAVVAALGWVTLEFPTFLIAIAICFLLVAYYQELIKISKAQILISFWILLPICVFWVTLIILWPGGIFNLGWAKIILIKTYTFAITKPSRGELFRFFFQHSPVYSILFTLGIIVFIYQILQNKRKCDIIIGLYVLPALIGLISIPSGDVLNGLNVYALLCITTGIAFAYLMKSRTRLVKFSAIIILIGSVLLTGYQDVTAIIANKVPKEVWGNVMFSIQGDGKNIIRFIQQNIDEQTPILADGAHIFKYYLPKHKNIVEVVPFNPDNFVNPEAYRPESEVVMNWTNILEEFQAKRFPVVIIEKVRDIEGYFGKTFAQLLKSDYQLQVSASDGAWLLYLQK